MGLKDNKRKSKNIFYSFKYAFEGIFYGFRTARNLIVDIVVAFLVVLFGFLLDISINEWLVVILCFGLVMSLELVNSAIEEVVDMTMPDVNVRAKRSKDLAAGAVLMSAFMSMIIGIIIFLPKLINLL